MTKWTKEYRAEYMKKYRENKIEELWMEYKRIIAKRGRKYYEKNKEVIGKKAKEYYQENKEYIRERERQCRREITEKLLQLKRNLLN